MGEPTHETRDRIKEAVLLRQQRTSWDKIAEKWGYANGESARRFLVWQYPEIWRAEYDAAYNAFLPDVETQARDTLVDLLEHKDAKTRESAAHSLLSYCARLRTQKIDMAVDTAAGYRRVVEEAERIRHELILKEQGMPKEGEKE